MAKKLSQMTPAGTLADTDLLLVSVNATTTPQSRRATVQQVRGTPKITLFDEVSQLGQYHTIKVVGSAVTVTEEAAGIAVLTVAEAAGGPASHLSEVTVHGKPAINTTLKRFLAPFAMTIPANFAGSQAFAEVAATVDTTLYINQEGVNIGSILFAAGSQVGVFTAVPVDTVFNLAAGDWVTLYTTGTQDATLADLGITLLLYK